MLESVQAFINRISERGHVLLLIEDVELTISFMEKEETVSILFQNGEVQLTDNESMINKLVINGESSALRELIEGQEPLRKLIGRGALNISAPFRTLLRLESIFCLGKIETKII